MDTKAIAKELIQHQKAAIDNAFEVVGLFQEQTEKISEVWIKRTADLAAENRKALQQWINLFTKGSQTYKKIVDDQLNMIETFLVIPTPSRTSKTVKPAPVKSNAVEGKKHTHPKKQQAS